jgi:hypothetical protein
MKPPAESEFANRLTLDCTALDTALRSIAAMSGRNVQQLQQAIDAAQIDWASAEIAPEEQIARQIGFTPDTVVDTYGVRWFHATRVAADETFADGLLPTMQAWPKIWDSLRTLAAEWLTATQFEDYRQSFMRGDRFFSRQFRTKQIAPNWQGPFAFLVRDAALSRHDGHKDFTRCSETAEDVCADFEEVYGYPLRDRYENNLRRCLVSFVWQEPLSYALRPAANYVFRTLKGVGCGMHCNTNFNGRGKPVSRHLIDRIEWLDN